MLIRAEKSTLLLIDLQQKLHPAIHQNEQVLAHSLWLTRLAQRLGVPVICTEQYPRGLGGTLPELRALLPDAALREKVHFSAVAEGNLFDAEGGARGQFVVAGTESHVCVLQTVLDLLEAGRAVFVVEEAVGSRRATDKALALERMRGAGAAIVSREMVAFEWLQRAGGEEFRAVSREFIR
jgi:nicotinamidase-related amidase